VVGLRGDAGLRSTEPGGKAICGHRPPSRQLDLLFVQGGVLVGQLTLDRQILTSENLTEKARRVYRDPDSEDAERCL
jgi:hypothetical protein